MVWIGRALVILHVARSAICRRPRKLPVHVALIASHCDVRAGQREFCEGIVIERCRAPRGSVVASLASLWEAGLRVIGIGRLLEIRQVATHAGCGRSGKFPAQVAGGAIKRRVRSGQGKPGLLQVVELSAEPGIGVVTLFACGWKTAGDVAWLRVLIVLGVTGITLGWQSLELAGGCAFVTGLAIQSRVCAN